MEPSAASPIQLLTFLGIGGYEPCYYRLGQHQSSRERYVQAALVDLLRQQGTPVDLVTVCLTDQAAERNWRTATLSHGETPPSDPAAAPAHQLGLEARLAGLAVTTEPIDHFPDGRSEAELWSMFDRLQRHLRPDHALVVDVTHGFRCFPIVLCIALAFLKLAGNLHLRAVYYGAWDAKDGDVAPVFDLTALLELLDWSSALGQLHDTGDARRLAERIAARPTARGLHDYAATVSALADALACAAAPELGPRAAALAAAAAPLATLDLPPELRPVAQVIGPIQQRYAALAPVAADLAGQVAAQLAAARLLFEHQQLQAGYTLLSEALDSLVAELLQARDRHNLGGRLGELPGRGVPRDYVARLQDLRSQVAVTRNAFNHAWTNRPFDSSGDLGSQGRDLANRIAKELLPLPNTDAVAERRMLVLLSHSLLPEQEQEARDKLDVRTFVWPDEADQRLLAQVPPDKTLTRPDGSTAGWLSNLRKRLQRLVGPGDCVLLQGEPGVTVYLVGEFQRQNVTCYHATTRREVEEQPQPDGSVHKISRFAHVMFREYPG